MSALPENLVARMVRAALQEDIGPLDLTCHALIPAGTRARGVITARLPLIVAGIEPARCAFAQLDPSAVFLRQAMPGVRLATGDVLLEVEAAATAILTAERTALNFLGRLSGIATHTSRCVEQIAGTGAAVYDTRKTTPGLRLLERDAVRLGGGMNHRFGLFDAVLIKDNHLVVAGGPGRAVRKAREVYGDTVRIEVEVEDLDGLDEALEAGADIVLLDNMTLEMLAEAVRRNRSRKRGALLEASGGVRLENIRAIALTGVERISVGGLTHSSPAADLSLTLQAIDPAGA